MVNRIRVLHYGMSPNLGGIETYLLNLTRTIRQSRFHFDFVYSDLGQAPIYAPRLPDSKFFGVTPRRVSLHRNRRDLHELFTHEHFDILHFHANTTSYVEPVRVALRHGTPVLYHSHNAGASRSLLTRAMHHWHKSILPWRRMQRIAVSTEAGQWMFGSQDFEVIHNGIDVDAFTYSAAARRAVRAALNVQPDTLVIGSVAAFLPAKNHDYLLRVFGKVLERQSDAHLLLVGAGPLEQQTRDRVAELGIQQSVRFLGRRSDIADLLSGMDALLLPSIHEGFPLAPLEAQASGLPCFISDAVTPEVIATPLCRQLPLGAPPATWAEEILRCSPTLRAPEPHGSLIQSFSLSANTLRMSEIYGQIAIGDGSVRE